MGIIKLMLGNDISLSKVVKLSYMEGFYFWHAMRLFVCPLREIALLQISCIQWSYYSGGSRGGRNRRPPPPPDPSRAYKCQLWCVEILAKNRRSLPLPPPSGNCCIRHWYYNIELRGCRFLQILFALCDIYPKIITPTIIRVSITTSF